MLLPKFRERKCSIREEKLIIGSRVLSLRDVCFPRELPLKGRRKHLVIETTQNGFTSIQALYSWSRRVEDLHMLTLRIPELFPLIPMQSLLLFDFCACLNAFRYLSDLGSSTYRVHYDI